MTIVVAGSDLKSPVLDEFDHGMWQQREELP